MSNYWFLSKEWKHHPLINQTWKFWKFTTGLLLLFFFLFTLLLLLHLITLIVQLIYIHATIFLTMVVSNWKPLFLWTCTHCTPTKNYWLHNGLILFLFLLHLYSKLCVNFLYSVIKRMNRWISLFWSFRVHIYLINNDIITTKVPYPLQM